MNKREFLRQLGSAAAISPFLPYSFGGPVSGARGYDQQDDTEFWARIREDYSLNPSYINLENGYYCMAPVPVMEKFFGHISRVNYEASYYMRGVQQANKQKIADRLAEFLGCNPGEVIITRNTTESLDLVIAGYPWKAGDEAIMAEQDYGAMIDQFKLVAARYGVVNKVVSVPNHPVSDEEIVALYESQITGRTKLLMICHMINITGHILPVRKLCEMAHSHGVEVLVDGAHCVGHIEVNIPDLGCDYYGSSLHKWLSAPLGCGMLYVRPSRQSQLWPLLASSEAPPGSVNRLNHTGTHPVHTDLAIGDALDYLHNIGMIRKENRLRYLQKYWSDALRPVEGILLNTPPEAGRSCGIGNVGIKHMAPADLARTLFEEFGIYTVAIDTANVRGCRITPNIYTSTEELDRFVEAMEALAKRG